MEDLKKSIVIPVDGSKNSLRSLDYLNLMFGPEHKMHVHLLYVMPSLPPLLIDNKTMDRKIRSALASVKRKNKEIAERVLAEAKKILIDKGFDEENVKPHYRQCESTIARDIRFWAKNKRADTILMSKRGRTDFKPFIMGSISTRLVEYCRDCPLWIVGGGGRSKKALIAVDSSENALRAVDHAGFMLSGTDCKATVFYTMRNLRRFIPLEALEDASDLEEFWRNKAGQQIAPYMKKAKEMLLDAGLSEDQIAIKVIDGSRSAADDILKEARENGFGTIVLGRRGLSKIKEIFMGSVTSKVLINSSGLTVWIVQ
ncbi:MAG: universal stress protein [Deltaproteobacteria bacterium]|nr:universal stress protein [Deltaproteobacteria bacterium]MBW2660776.1 universal stress protein [Deltaproteobacteria bacterium]